MARTKKPARTRDDIVNDLLELFFVFGYNGTTLSLIAERTGLGRASLYHHFPGGKEEMARAVLEKADHWGEEFVARIAWAETLGAEEKLGQILRNIDAVHHHPLQLTPANAFVIGDNTALYRQHIAQRVSGLAFLIGELLCAIGVPRPVAQRRGWEMQLLWEGGLVMARLNNDMGIFRDLMRNMPSYLLAPVENIGCLTPEFLMSAKE